MLRCKEGRCPHVAVREGYCLICADKRERKLAALQLKATRLRDKLAALSAEPLTRSGIPAGPLRRAQKGWGPQ